MTNLLEILIVGLVLCADSFSAALAMGARPHRFSDTLKFAFSSGGAEVLVAFLGAIAGAQIIARFELIDNWVAFILLSLVAIHMAYEGIRDLRSKGKTAPQNFHSYAKVLIVSFATSLDAFAVGVSLGVSQKPLLPYMTSIGLWAFFSTILGMGIAKRASARLGPASSLLGSAILFALAIKFLIDGF